LAAVRRGGASAFKLNSYREYGVPEGKAQRIVVVSGRAGGRSKRGDEIMIAIISCPSTGATHAYISVLKDAECLVFFEPKGSPLAVDIYFDADGSCRRLTISGDVP